MKSANGPGLPLVRELTQPFVNTITITKTMLIALFIEILSPMIAAIYSDDSDRSFFIRLATSS